MITFHPRLGKLLVITVFTLTHLPEAKNK